MNSNDIGHISNPHSKSFVNKIFRTFVLTLLIILNVTLLLAVIHLILLSSSSSYASRTPIASGPLCSSNPKPLKKPLVTDLHHSSLSLNSTTTLNNIRVSLNSENAEPKVGDRINLTFLIENVDIGDLIFSSSIHESTTHFYAYPSHDASNFFHAHPPVKHEQFYRINETFVPDVSGDWRIVLQFSIDGTVYHLTHTMPVKISQSNQDVISSPEKVQNKNKVEIRIESKLIRAGEQFTMYFDLESEKNAPDNLCRVYLYDSHNVFLIHAESEEIWNAHGDGSTRLISKLAHYDITRLPIQESPFGYRLQLPYTGIWHIRYEGLVNDTFELLVQ